MKVFFNRLPRYEPYGGGSHFVTSMVEYLKNRGHTVVFHLEEGVDTIFMIDPRPGDIGYSINHIIKYKELFPEVKILHRINECDARKNTNFIDKILIESATYADKVVFISQWLKDYFRDIGMNVEKSSVIYNGCNIKNYYPDQKTQTRKLKVVTHHWSDNWLKGFDIYKEIDQYLETNEDFEFTYVGRYSKLYSPKNTNLVSPLHGYELGEELRKHDVYVTASRSEPCGMHHIEGAACGLPVLYHKDSGGINELCKNHGEEFKDFKDFLEKLNKVKSELKSYVKKIDYNNLNIEKCCEMFYNELKQMHIK